MSPQRQGMGSPFDPFQAKDDKKQQPQQPQQNEALKPAPSAASTASPEQASMAERTLSQEDAPGLSLQPSDSSSLDPFGIGSLTQQPSRSTTEPASGSLISRSVSSATEASSAGPPVLALPPKMLIKMTTYEEVTSVATVLDPGHAKVSVEGSVYVQLHSSDARRNAPFQLIPTKDDESVSVRPNNKYTKRPATPHSSALTVSVPKHELGYVPVLYYSMEQMVDHMPVLLERKVTIHEDSCRIAFQVRTKLTNRGDLRDFTLAVAVPEKVDADSIEILRGDGVYDGLKRLIKYKLASLVKGESFMVSAQANLCKSLGDDEDIHFPVVMRCTSSEDQISSVDFSAVEAPGQPSSLTVHKAHSFRLLHRLS